MEGTLNIKKDKLSFLDFLATLKWLILFNYKLSPIASVSKIIISVLLDLSPLFSAYIFALLLDKIIKIANIPNSNPKEIIPLLGLLLAYNVFISLFSYLYDYVAYTASSLAGYRAPQFFYKQIHSLGIQTLENPTVVNKIQRSREALNATDRDFDLAISFFSRIITLISVSIIILKIMPIVALIIFAAMIPGLISSRIFRRKSWRLFRDETENRRKAFFAASSLTDTSNLQEITITSAFEYIHNVFKNFANRFVAADLKIRKDWNTYGFLLGSITSLASIFGYFSILKNLFNKLISVGDVTFQMRSLDMFVSNLSRVNGSFVSLYERSIRLSEIKELFEMKPMVADGEVDLPNLDIPPIIEFENVNFQYPNADNYVIKNLNLHIKPGEKIAIVGENGAGKTTLVKLLSRFYKVNEGRICLNSININDINIRSWYKNLSVLFQDFNTYSYLNLKENIYLGESYRDLDMSRLELAAHKASIDSFVVDYKNGYDQILSEKFKGGTRPSTGQWQKIAIARFFYRNSPVVIFDEPTASIDAVSEAEIFGRIYDFFKGKTVIIISHRFSTVRNADKIYVLDKGEIVESGNHKELMKLKGRYYKAFNIQAKGYK